MNRQSIITALGFSLVISSLTACGPDTEENLNEEIDHATAQQALTQNTEAMAKGISEAVAFLEDSAMMERGFGIVAQQDCVTAPEFDDQGNEIGEVESCDGGAELNTDLSEPSAELTDFLKTRVFTQDNVESEQAREITYLLKSQNLCAQEEGESKTSCVSFFDQAQLRIVVTSPAPNDLSLKLLVGAAKANPATLELGAKSLAVTADLAAAKASALTIAQALGEEAPELPETMQGKVRASLNRPADKKLEAAFAVTSAVKIAGADYDIQVAVANPAMSMNIDGVAKTMNHEVNWAAISAKFPVWEYEDVVTTETDEFGNEFESYESTPKTKHSALVSLGGINGQMLFDAAQEVVKFQGLGLGDATTTVSVDGEQILAVDLNPAANRRVDLSLSQGQDDQLQLDIAPSLDLSVAFALAKIQSKFSELDAPQWALDETFKVVAQGANPVQLLLGDQLKVLTGSLTLSATKAQLTHTVNADQCLGPIEQADEPAVPVEPGDGSEGSVDGEEHPFSAIEVQACQ